MGIHPYAIQLERFVYREGTMMDIAFVGLVLVLCGMTLGLIRICERV